MAAHWDDMVVVGRVARAHGNRGEVIVNPETDFVGERFAVGSALSRRDGAAVRVLRVARSRMHLGRPVIGFEGVDTMTEAEALAGAELRVPEGALRELAEGAFWEHDLAGCRVEDAAGREIGTVRSLDGAAGNRWLVIEAAGGEVLVPFAAAVCVTIDVAARRIVIDPPEGLLEANAPGKPRRPWKRRGRQS